MADEILQLLARALSQYVQPAVGQKASGTPISSILYGEGGLFGQCDGSNVLINALVGPIGFEKYLRWVGTDTEKEFVDAWTDIDVDTTKQATACGNCAKATMKACSQFYCFGRFCNQSQELQFDNIGLRAHSGIPIRSLFGSITAADGAVIVPQGSEVRDDFFVQAALVGYALRLQNSQLLWAGNPANNTGAYKEYNGFNIIINTGKFDAYTQQYCNALDAFLLNMNYNAFTTDGTYAVRSWFQRMIHQFRRRAEGAGFDWDSATMYIVMTPNMWECVARAYACAGLDLCSVSTTTNNVTASADQAQSRYEEYLTRMALPIDGKWYPVVLDSQITESTGQANGICSDVYFITTEISGRTITYGEYQDFNMTYGRVRQELASMFGSDDIAIVDNGRFAIVRDNVRGCFDIQEIVKPRLVAEMPQLTGRIRNACCNPIGQPLPDATGSGRVYELGGGRSVSPVPTLYGNC